MADDRVLVGFRAVATRIDSAALTAGKTVTVYGQQEVMRGLYDAPEQRSIPRLWLITAAFALRLPRNITRTAAISATEGVARHHLVREEGAKSNSVVPCNVRT
jgi:hypothetical protein